MNRFLVTLALCLVAGCATITKFDQNSLDSAKDLKVESLALLAHGLEPGANYLGPIQSLESKLSAQLAYEQGKGAQNTLTAKQWELLTSKDHLLGKFLTSWKAGAHFSPLYLQDTTEMIGEGFDTIIHLEAAKIR